MDFLWIFLKSSILFFLCQPRPLPLHLFWPLHLILLPPPSSSATDHFPIPAFHPWALSVFLLQSDDVFACVLHLHTVYTPKGAREFGSPHFTHTRRPRAVIHAYYKRLSQLPLSPSPLPNPTPLVPASRDNPTEIFLMCTMVLYLHFYNCISRYWRAFRYKVRWFFFSHLMSSSNKSLFAPKTDNSGNS